MPRGPRRDEIRQWVEETETRFGDRVLGIDIEVAQIWGELTARGQQRGTTIPNIDGLIAATALRNGLYVMTRNVKDFEPTGVLLMNPWDDER